MNQFKNNFWPRPRDEATDFLLTAAAEVQEAAIVTAMTIWNDVLYFATSRAGVLPRLFRWDGETLQEIAPPPWTNGIVGMRITVMAVYNNELWIATSPNGVAAPNQVIEIWVWNGTAWFDAKTFAGWLAAPLNPCESIAAGGWGAGWMFVFDSMIFVGQDTAAVAVGVEIQAWNGTTWLGAVEVVGVGGVGPAAGSSTTPTSRMHAPILNNEVYVGAYDARAAAGGGTADAEVYRRDTAGTWTLTYTFPNTGVNTPTDPVEVLVRIDDDIWAAHGNDVNALSGDPMQLARIRPLPNLVRRTGLGLRSGFTLAGAEGHQVAIVASPEKLWVFDPRRTNLELLTEYADDAPLTLLVFRKRIHVAQGSALVAGINTPGFTARIGRLE